LREKCGQIRHRAKGEAYDKKSQHPREICSNPGAWVLTIQCVFSEHWQGEGKVWMMLRQNKRKMRKDLWAENLPTTKICSSSAAWTLTINPSKHYRMNQ
jgi:hypothetical protein